jgi:hypothetical protein
MPKADPKFSEGARYERRMWLAAVRRHINIEVNDLEPNTTNDTLVALRTLERYGETRQKAPSGLGKR